MHAKYPLYIAEVLGKGETVMERLIFVKKMCLEMFEESDDKTKEMVRKQMRDNSLDMPEHLENAQGTLSEEEVKWYQENYQHQL